MIGEDFLNQVNERIEAAGLSPEAKYLYLENRGFLFLSDPFLSVYTSENDVIVAMPQIRREQGHKNPVGKARRTRIVRMKS